MNWTAKHVKASTDHLGMIPSFFSESDPRPAREQIAERYAHGGGWSPLEGWKSFPDGSIQYPGDPPKLVLWETKLRSETIRVYFNAWVGIFQEDGSFEVARID